LTNIQDELAQRDRKHGDKYAGGNKRHLEGVETITGTGETDLGVTAEVGDAKQKCTFWKCREGNELFFIDQ
jgi:hypothetical protein